MALIKRARASFGPLPGGIGGLVTLTAVLVVSGCSGGAEAPQGEENTRAEVAEAGSGWIAPPAVTRLTHEGGELVISGTAHPGGRVVLRTSEDRTYATVADMDGRFAVRLTGRDGLVLIPEALQGQESVPSPARLVILDAVGGEGVLLSPGSGSVRLGPAPALSGVDFDGRSVVISGMADPSSQVRVEVNGGRVMPVTADLTGLWRLGMDASPVFEVRVNGAAFEVPAMAVQSASSEAVTAITLSDSEAGYLLQWFAPDGAPQATWLPRR